jgi:hypothetical protein
LSFASIAASSAARLWWAGLEKDLGGCAPDHNHPVAGVRSLEIADVRADGLGLSRLPQPPAYHVSWHMTTNSLIC